MNETFFCLLALAIGSILIGYWGRDDNGCY